MLEPFRQGENEKKKKKNNEGQSVCKVRRMGKHQGVNGNGQDRIKPLENQKKKKKTVIQSNQSMEVVVLYGLNVVLSAAK
ncbi:hypothetical protein ACJIZ3_000348 [Penstemon smallii]|uniref:Uncharacterized protein n=1 Tax=Penstemon smallii TaxID=265156 RepID=A0ABD3RJZ8_9LAMI